MSIIDRFKIPYYNVFEDRNLTDIPHGTEEAYEFEEYIAVWLTIFTTIEAIATQLFHYKCEPNDFNCTFAAFICLHFTKLSMRWIDVKIYSWIYTNYAIIRLPSNSIWVFLLQFILIDFTFYWWHRAAREVNIFGLYIKCITTLNISRMPRLLDKNYAGIFIIWDKLFGTLEPERKNEKVVYGLVHNVRTFNQFYIQCHHFQEIFFKFLNMKTVGDKLKALFYGPGWLPGTHRLGNYEDIPDVEYSIEIYDPPTSRWFKFYTRIHATLNFLLHLYFMGKVKTMSTTLFVSYVVFILYTILCNKYAEHLELLRCVITCIWLFLIDDIWIYFLYFSRLLCVLSIFYWLVKIFRPNKHVKTS